MVLISLRRSQKRSALASGVSANEYKTPACSPTKSRSLPGLRAMSKGFLNFRFGNARTTLKGGGGSGEPTTRDVTQGVRTDFAGQASLDGGDFAADGTRQAAKPDTRKSSKADTERDKRCRPREGDGMNSTPE